MSNETLRENEERNQKSSANLSYQVLSMLFNLISSCYLLCRCQCVHIIPKEFEILDSSSRAHAVWKSTDWGFHIGTILNIYDEYISLPFDFKTWVTGCKCEEKAAGSFRTRERKSSQESWQLFRVMFTMIRSLFSTHAQECGSLSLSFML